MVQKRGGVSTFSSSTHSFCAIAYLARAVALCAFLAHCGPPVWIGGIHAQLAWSPRGVRVLAVPAEGAAAEAGLLADDRLLAIDGKPIAGLNDKDVQQRLSGDVGTFVTLTVKRAESTLDLRVERVPYRRDKGR